MRFGNPENDIRFDSSLERLLNKPNKTMGIVELVLDRERRIGEKKAREQKLTFVRNLITSTDFDNAKIAALADVTVEVVQKIRLEFN